MAYLSQLLNAPVDLNVRLQWLHTMQLAWPNKCNIECISAMIAHAWPNAIRLDFFLRPSNWPHRIGCWVVACKLILWQCMGQCVRALLFICPCWPLILWNGGGDFYGPGNWIACMLQWSLSVCAVLLYVYGHYMGVVTRIPCADYWGTRLIAGPIQRRYDECSLKI